MFKSIKKKLEGSIIGKIIVISLISFIVLSLFLEFVIMRRHLPFNVEIERSKWIDIITTYSASLLGGVISIVGIWWQIESAKKQEKSNKESGLNEYFKYILEKNLQDRYEKNFSLQRVISLSAKCHNINDEIFISFDESFISDNLKIIMDLRYGTKILDVFYEVKEFNALIEKVIKDFTHRSGYITKLKEYARTLEETSYKNNIEILELVSLMVDRINHPNPTQLKDLQDNLKTKLHCFEEINFIDLNITHSHIKEIISYSKTENDSKRTNEIFINLLDAINSGFSSYSDYLSNYKDMYQEIRELTIIYRKINGKSFLISKNIEELSQTIS